VSATIARPPYQRWRLFNHSQLCTPAAAVRLLLIVLDNMLVFGVIFARSSTAAKVTDSALDGRTTRHAGYAVSQRIRKPASGSRRSSAGARPSARLPGPCCEARAASARVGPSSTILQHRMDNLPNIQI
jgi:hypothetical protein